MLVELGELGILNVGIEVAAVIGSRSLVLKILEELDRLLSGCSNWLILVCPALVEDIENIFFIIEDLCAQMGSNAVHSIYRHSLGDIVLGLLNLLNK